MADKFNDFSQLDLSMFGFTEEDLANEKAAEAETVTPEVKVEPEEEPKFGVREKVASFNNYYTLDEPGDTRDADDTAERKFTGWLETNIYPLFKEAGLANDIKSVVNRDGQVKGRDAIYYTDNGSIRVDNKNRGSVINRHNTGIPLEIYTDNKYGQRIVGWLVDKEKDTDYICSTHCFTNSGQKDMKDVADMSDIRKMDIFFIKLDDVRKYLETQGISYEGLKTAAKEFEQEFRNNTYGMKKDDISSDMRHKELCPGVTLYTSIRSVKENPTVILFDESVAKMLPNTRHFVWGEKFGLIEREDKANRPDLTRSEENEKKAQNRNDITY